MHAHMLYVHAHNNVIRACTCYTYMHIIMLYVHAHMLYMHAHVICAWCMHIIILYVHAHTHRML